MTVEIITSLNSKVVDFSINYQESDDAIVRIILINCV
jgi:hypothetical protein